MPLIFSISAKEEQQRISWSYQEALSSLEIKHNSGVGEGRRKQMIQEREGEKYMGGKNKMRLVEPGMLKYGFTGWRKQGHMSWEVLHYRMSATFHRAAEAHVWEARLKKAGS